ncbi:MAG TPA: hypothetical protein PLM53_20285 [Spirochaetota bacterium]|nr:hypothetical protein [Spirochaetota bacterium]
MGDRKRNIDFMKDLLSIYNGQENKSGFRKEQISLIQELLALDYLNDSSFSFNKGGGEIWACAMTGEYPLTAKGREYIEMGWYRSLQQSGKYQLARDIAAFIGAAIGIIISIINIISK